MRQGIDGSQKPDNRSTHRIGCDRLILELRQFGIHAEPSVKTRGVDFFVTRHQSGKPSQRLRIPILVRAASKANFSVIRRHEKISNLILAFVWHLRSGNPAETFAMTFNEALSIAEEMGWTSTGSWQRFGWYTNNEPGKRLRAKLTAFKSTPDRWRHLTGY